MVIIVDQQDIDDMRKVERPIEKGEPRSALSLKMMSDSRRGSSSKHPSGIEGLLIDIEKHLDRR